MKGKFSLTTLHSEQSLPVPRCVFPSQKQTARDEIPGRKVSPWLHPVQAHSRLTRRRHPQEPNDWYKRRSKCKESSTPERPVSCARGSEEAAAIEAQRDGWIPSRKVFMKRAGIRPEIESITTRAQIPMQNTFGIEHCLQ